MTGTTQSSVLSFYESVIDDTIESCHFLYTDDGLDRNVLDELKLIWTTKLKQCSAVRHAIDSIDLNATTSNENSNDTGVKSAANNDNNNTNKNALNDETSISNEPTESINPQQTSISNQSQCSTTTVVQPQSFVQQPQRLRARQNANCSLLVSQQRTQQSPQLAVVVPAGVATTSTIIQLEQARLIRVQITLPQNRVVLIQVPQIFLSGHKLKEILNGTVIQATLGMSATEAQTYLQNHIDTVYQNELRSRVLTRIVTQLDGSYDVSDTDDKNEKSSTKKSSKKSKKAKLSYASEISSNETSESDENESDSSSEGDTNTDSSDDKSSENGSNAALGDEEPLNSNDDLTDGETEDFLDTDNVIVCQYERVIRNRNKWRFALKDGIMNLNGKDYVFHKLFGDGNW